MAMPWVSHHLRDCFMHCWIRGGWQETWWAGASPVSVADVTAPRGRWLSENPCLGPFLLKVGAGG